MSVFVSYKFVIKTTKPDFILKNILLNGKVNYNYLYNADDYKNIKTSNNLFLAELFGVDYYKDINALINSNSVSIEYNNCGKNCLKLDMWFKKFKSKLEVFMYESDKYFNIDHLQQYIHYFYKNNVIAEENSISHIGKQINKVFAKDEITIKDYLKNNFDMPSEFESKSIDELLLIFSSIYPSIFKFLPKKYNLNRNFIIKCLNNNFNVYCFISEKFRNDREIIMSALNSRNNYNHCNSKDYFYQDIFEVIRKKYANDFQIVSLFIKNNKLKFKFFREYFDNKDMALLSIDKNSAIKNYDYFSERLKNDNDIIKKCVLYDIFDNNNFCEKFKNNKKIILYAINHCKNENNSIINNISDDMKNDDEIIELSLKKFPKSYKYVTDKYKNNYELSMTVLKKDRTLFSYVGDDLLKDYNFCIEYFNYIKLNNDNSIYCNGYDSLKYVKNDELLADNLFVIDTIKNGATLWGNQDIFKNFLDNEEVMFYALLCDNLLFQYLPYKYRDNYLYALASITNKSSVDLDKPFSILKEELENRLKSIKDDNNVDLLKKDCFLEDAGDNIRYMSDRLRKDENFILYSIDETPSAIRYVESNMRNKIIQFRNKKNKRNIVIKLNL